MRLESGEDAALQRRFAGGDVAVTNVIFEAIRPELLAIVQRRFREAFPDADHAVNDFFVVRWTIVCRTYDSRRGGLTAFAGAAFGNHCLDLLRAQARSRAHEAPLDSNEAGAAPPPADARDSDERGRLQEAMHRLSDEDRHLVTLRFYEERKLVDIADKLGVSPSTAFRRLHNVLRKLELWMQK
jgi:RNA polymerase sigma factor (sigma-70 family)